MFLYQSFTSDEQCEKNDNVQNCRNKHGLLIFVSSIVIQWNLCVLQRNSVLWFENKASLLDFTIYVEDDNDYLGWINCTMHA